MLRDAAPKVLFADGMCSAAVLGALSSAAASSTGPVPPPLIVWVTSSADAASTHEGYAQGISSGRLGGDRPGAHQAAGSASAAAAMLPYESCFVGTQTSANFTECVDSPQCWHMLTGLLAIKHHHCLPWTVGNIRIQYETATCVASQNCV